MRGLDGPGFPKGPWGKIKRTERQRGQCGTAQLPEQGNNRDQTHRANHRLRQSALVTAEPPPRPGKHKREVLCSLENFGNSAAWTAQWNSVQQWTQPITAATNTCGHWALDLLSGYCETKKLHLNCV